jgi:hypothetical protein
MGEDGMAKRQSGGRQWEKKNKNKKKREIGMIMMNG